jgi:dTDP-D-glucose 4,6-dehydratase
MEILLTGASGFAGAHMLKFLMQNTSSNVTCPVTYKHGGHQDRIPAILPIGYESRFELVNLDLTDFNQLDSLNFSKFDLVINFASESHVDRSIAEPLAFTANNSDLMINLLEKTRKIKGLPFIHLSTDEVYGAIPKNETNYEWERVHLPSNPYSASKSAQESLAVAYFKTYGMPICIINATNMLGEAQNQEKFIPKAISRISYEGLVSIDTDDLGTIGTRKYLDVSDVACAVWVSSETLKQHKVLNRRSDLPLKVHISGIEEISNKEVVEIIGKEMNRTPRMQISPSPRPGYDLRYELSSSIAEKIGWVASGDIRNRIAEVCRWTLKNPDWLKNDHNNKSRY